MDWFPKKEKKSVSFKCAKQLLQSVSILEDFRHFMLSKYKIDISILCLFNMQSAAYETVSAKGYKSH